MLLIAHIQKTAGITIVRILRRSFGAAHCDAIAISDENAPFTAEDFRKTREIYPELECLAGHQIFPWTDLDTAIPDAKYFCMVRDPLKRAASNFQYHVQIMGYKGGYDRWILNEKYQNVMVKHLAGEVNVEKAKELVLKKDFLFGQVEKFDESMVMLRRWLGNPKLDIRYKRENVAPDNRLKDEVLNNPDNLERLRAANQADVDFYDWLKDEVFPRQYQKWGEGLAEEVNAFKDSNKVPVFSVKGAVSRIKRNMVYKPFVRRERRRTAALKDG